MNEDISNMKLYSTYLLDTTNLSIIDYSITPEEELRDETSNLKLTSTTNSSNDITDLNGLVTILNDKIIEFQPCSDLLHTLSDVVVIQVIEILETLHKFEEENSTRLITFKESDTVVEKFSENVDTILNMYMFVMIESYEYLTNVSQQNHSTTINPLQKENTTLLENVRSIKEKWSKLYYFPDLIVSHLTMQELKLKHCLLINKNNETISLKLFKYVFMTCLIEMRKLFIKLISHLIDNSKDIKDEIHVTFINFIDILVDCSIEIKCCEILVGIRSIIKMWICCNDNYVDIYHWCKRKQLSWEIEQGKQKLKMEENASEEEEEEEMNGLLLTDQCEFGKLFIKDILRICKEYRREKMIQEGQDYSIDLGFEIDSQYDFKNDSSDEYNMTIFDDDYGDVAEQQEIDHFMKQEKNILDELEQLRNSKRQNINSIDELSTYIKFDPVDTPRRKKRHRKQRVIKPPSILGFWWTQQTDRIQRSIQNAKQQWDMIFLKEPKRDVVDWVEHYKHEKDTKCVRVVTRQSKRTSRYWKTLCATRVVQPASAKLLSWLE
ncbi:hypothetical protein TBLA_0B00400 [Henningerozyma blattae CBS 6284]|uniref:Uncharacterized protein n=1 Tax=Henningerozyma blattae (strain ATCC 34711 / CBS 6284 / DSM 70876 / NBRC 10599 / NRRL Y-10934 / UCD 77-7) TaxID=1071380 RepID=I2GXN2_HENB6|nr:hypothetical protein TBLA_0B00400 [Tetrapisispora blattae CBS 6284]CCH58884.1 hypothetical protein TBLA_0B00400 [Tetrapisispora blattae CBS 6284]